MTLYRSTFETPEQALAEALFLALMAPDDEKAQACAILAEEIAADHGLDEQAVELAKAAALERFELDVELDLPERHCSGKERAHGRGATCGSRSVS